MLKLGKVRWRGPPVREKRKLILFVKEDCSLGFQGRVIQQIHRDFSGEESNSGVHLRLRIEIVPKIVSREYYRSVSKLLLGGCLCTSRGHDRLECNPVQYFASYLAFLKNAALAKDVSFLVRLGKLLWGLIS